MNNNLVTVGVISYNSSKTIEDTLISIFNQSYNEIELIISDDGSSDETVRICKEWLNKYGYRFTNTLLIESTVNNGTSANCNRLLRNAKGAWFKIIAADDVLLKDSIQKCVDFISKRVEVKWMVGKTKKYLELIDDDHLISDDKLYTTRRLSILNGTLDEQLEAIYDYTFIEAPATFMNTSILKEVGGYNEKYRLLEDWPMYMKLLKAGYRCYFLDDYIVGYRKSSNSVFNISSKLFNIGYKKSLYDFERGELFNHHKMSYRINKSLHYYLCVIYQRFGLNNSNKINRKSYSILSGLIDNIL